MQQVFKCFTPMKNITSPDAIIATGAHYTNQLETLALCYMSCHEHEISRMGTRAINMYHARYVVCICIYIYFNRHQRIGPNCSNLIVILCTGTCLYVNMVSCLKTTIVSIPNLVAWHSVNSTGYHLTKIPLINNVSVFDWRLIGIRLFRVII